MDFEADPNNKLKPLVKKHRFQNQLNFIKFPFITQLKYGQKLDFEASPEYFRSISDGP